MTDLRGRKPIYDDRVIQAILKCRAQYPSTGAAILRHLLIKHPDKYGLDGTDQIPSRATVQRVIADHGLANKPVGRGDRRSLPFDPHEFKPGYFYIDGWGPWNVRGWDIYTVNIIDARTRLALSIPSLDAMTLGESRYGKPTGTTNDTWVRTIACARKYLLETTEELTCVQADNGVYMAPIPASQIKSAWTLPLATRYALSVNATVRFVPPARPQHNGRIERWQWTCEREFWQTKRPQSVNEAIEGLVWWNEYYNTDRPHQRFAYKSPFEEYPRCYTSIWDRYWENVDVPKLLEPQYGVVYAVRMVNNDGSLDLWNAPLVLSPELGGQYVLVKLFVMAGQEGEGLVMWRRSRRHEYEYVARFKHYLDVPYKDRRNLRGFIFDVEMLKHDFSFVPPNQRLDEELEANRQSRVNKRKSKLSKQLEERAEERAELIARTKKQKLFEALVDEHVKRQQQFDALMKDDDDDSDTKIIPL